MGRVPAENLVCVTGALALAACQIGSDSDVGEPEATVAAAESPPRTCGTVEPPDDTPPPPEPEPAPEPAPELAPELFPPPPPPGFVRINVYFNIVVSASTGEGDLKQETLNEQLRILDDAFFVAGFYFRQAGVARVERNSWFTMLEPGSAAEASVKSALHRGTAEDLNIYTASPVGDVLGWASLPEFYRDNPINDGVVLHYRAMPGGREPFDEGDTLVHEVGHWLGLLHTFHGGCSKHNDLVGDTPAQDGAVTGCVFNRDSCTGEEFPGEDPLLNYMGFLNDACMVMFTPGQAERMQEAWTSYRLGN